MKKLLTAAAFLAAGTALSNAATPITFTDTKAANYNSTIHGFQFTLSAMTAPETVSGDFSLDSMTVRSAGGNTGLNVPYALLVLNLSDNTVLGYSKEVNTSAQNASLRFTFSAIGGDSLVIDYDTTYRFLTVDRSVVFAITEAGDDITSFIYTAGGTGTVATTASSTTLTIAQGLKAPGIRGHYNNSDPSDVANTVIVGANGQNLSSALGSAVTSVTATAIPEPSAFGLLAGIGALALVAARRRRK